MMKKVDLNKNDVLENKLILTYVTKKLWPS